MARRLVILDRDGVINHDSDEFIKSADEWEPIDGSIEAISRLTQAGYRVVVATNQSGIPRGLFSIEMLHDMHDKLQALLAEAGSSLEAIFICPELPPDGEDDRKRRLLDEIAQRYHQDLEDIPVVGDGLADIRAAQAHKARPMLVRTGRGEATLEALGEDHGLEVFDNLAGVADALTGVRP